MTEPETPANPTPTPNTPQRPVRIANCSGFYGDRLAAAREMVEDGPIDVLTGDYLAELTMSILWKARAKDPSAGYARTFVTQMEQVMGTCLDRGIRIVANAGGLNPAGLAERLRTSAQRLGLAPRIAHITGDDVLTKVAHGPQTVTANAYLGAWGITEALAAGADIVVCPRVTDASLVVGPAAWWHGWRRADHDRIAGAIVAGHVIECGPQATGGNYPFLGEQPRPPRPGRTADFALDTRRPGFPIAEVAADGSAVITKHRGTGGLVSIGTVTAQLLYEIGGPAYANPDAVARFDTVRLTAAGPDRVRIHGVRGLPPPATLKVGVNELGGYRNTMTMVLTGLDIETKAAHAEHMLFAALGGRDRFAEVDVRLLRFDRPDAPTNEQATAHLRITVKDPDPTKVGRAFSGTVVELALAGYPGFHTTTPPTAETAYGIFRAASIPTTEVEHTVVLPDGRSRRIPPPELTAPLPESPAQPGIPGKRTGNRSGNRSGNRTGTRTRRVPLGLVCGARSGDKGGDANLGLWARDDAGFRWLRGHLTVDRLRELLPEASDLPIERYVLDNLRAVNFVLVGLLGDGVAASTRPDPQAKGLAEYIRSRHTDIPTTLLDG
ncbi:acyclic terpene utilization AtuA family protein [Embleya sp. AB8]|uniref:acyclic terpene utilization AtuA family protein n=1 Tax=Embleya sp. AB8 TaxID=3156304 RepID=UPI003C725703